MYEPLPEPPIPVPAPPIRPIDRLGAAFEVFLISGLPTQILLVAILYSLGMSMRTPEGGMSARFVFTVSLADAALVIALVVVLLRGRNESVRQVLVGRVQVSREVLIGFALIPLVFLIVIVVMIVILAYAPSLRNIPKNPLEDLVRTRSDAAIFAVVVMVAGGLREEVQRGFIVHRFDGFLGGGLIGVLVYSILFGLGHFEQGWDATIATGALGVFWGLVYLRRRSIVAPIVSHAGFNFAQVVKVVWLKGILGT